MGRRMRSDVDGKLKRAVLRVADRPAAKSTAFKHSRFQFRCPLCGWWVWTEGTRAKEGVYPGSEPILNTRRIDDGPYEPELIAVVFGGKNELDRVSYAGTGEAKRLLVALRAAVKRLDEHLGPPAVPEVPPEVEEPEPEVEKVDVARLEGELDALREALRTKRPNVKSGEAALKKMEALGVDVGTAQDLLDNYREIRREDYDDADEYRDEKQDAWDAFLEEVDNLEVDPELVK